jgi:hypothetical protein
MCCGPDVFRDAGAAQDARRGGGEGIPVFTTFAAEAGEILAAVEVAMAAGLPYAALRDAVLTLPTMAEGLTDLFSSVPREDV